MQGPCFLCSRNSDSTSMNDALDERNADRLAGLAFEPAAGTGVPCGLRLVGLRAKSGSCSRPARSLVDRWHARRNGLAARPSARRFRAAAADDSRSASGMFAFALARLTESAFPDRTLAPSRNRCRRLVQPARRPRDAANTTWFAASIFTGEDSWLARSGARSLPPFRSCAALLARRDICIGSGRRRPHCAGRGACSSPSARYRPRLASRVGAADDASRIQLRWRGCAPHVVILGIDSLRNDLSRCRRRVECPDAQYSTHSLRTPTASATRPVPLARTYPAWVSILTGRHPVPHQCPVQPDAARARPRRRHARRRTPRTGLSRRLRDGRSALRKLRRDLRLRPADHAAGWGRRISLLGYAGDLPLVNLAA